MATIKKAQAGITAKKPVVKVVEKKTTIKVTPKKVVKRDRTKDNPADEYKGMKDAQGNPAVDVGGEGRTPPFKKGGVIKKKMKAGGSFKKAQTGNKFGAMGKSTSSMPSIPTGNNAGSSQQKINDNVKKINMSDAANSLKKNMAGTAKSGGKMKKCKYGCK